VVLYFSWKKLNPFGEAEVGSSMLVIDSEGMDAVGMTQDYKIRSSVLLQLISDTLFISIFQSFSQSNFELRESSYIEKTLEGDLRLFAKNLEISYYLW